MSLNSILTGIFCILVSWQALAQRFDKSILLEGRRREFIVVQPSGIIPQNGFPVVFMFHGTSGDGEKMYQTSGWKELGETEKFISVYPSSLAYCINDPLDGMRVTTKWNNGDLQSIACPGQLFRDDLSFVRSMVDTIKKSFSIDPRRIYACGFSNGGVMTAKLATNMSEVFAATVTASGILHDLDSAEIQPRIPCWLTVGTMDERFLDAIKKPYLPYNDTALVFLDNVIRNFTGSMGLNSDYSRKDSFGKLTLYEFGLDLNNKSTDNKLLFLLAKDMFHVFPNGTNYPVFESAPLYWHQFFKNIIKTQSTPVSSAPPITQNWSLSPNPAKDLIRISGSIPFHNETFRIIDFHGREWKKIAVSGLNPILDIRELPSGMYFIYGRSGKGKLIKL